MSATTRGGTSCRYLVTVDCTGISPSDAVAHRADPPELFDIEMDELTRRRTGSAGSKAPSLFSPKRRRTRPNRGR
jgi:hypothetical protein